MKRPDEYRERLGQILVDRGIVTSKQLDEALQEQELTGRFIGEIIVSRGVASEEQVARSLSEQLGFAFVELSNLEIEPKASELVPEELCHRYTAMPLFIMQDTLTIAMSNPLDVKAVDEIQAASGYRVRPVFACPTSIRNAIEKQFHEPLSRLDSASIPSIGHEDVHSEQIASLKQSASVRSVVNLVDDFIAKAVEMGASDIHLEPERNSFNCRYRIDGVLYPMFNISLEEQPSVISRIKIMANMDIAEKRLAQDGRFRIYVAGRDVDLRVSTFPSIYGENVVMRILDRSSGIIKLEQLGFSDNCLKAFSQLIRRPYGIILVSGPTGSGKTTTLYSALSEINSLEKNIITLEDPVEYEIQHVRQSQVNVKAGLTFAKGLRSLVRQDPDVIMIGEIRDTETADIAINAALTGHLVFSTIHTNDAASSASRLIDMGVEPFLVASSVIGILAQRLVRTLCRACREGYAPSAELIEQLGISKSEQRNNKLVFYKEAGCSKCKQRGYTGRTAIYELLIPSDHMKDLISTKVSAVTLREEAIKAGVKLLRQAGLEKVISGLTSVSELLRITEEA